MNPRNFDFTRSPNDGVGPASTVTASEAWRVEPITALPATVGRSVNRNGWRFAVFRANAASANRSGPPPKPLLTSTSMVIDSFSRASNFTRVLRVVSSSA